jgi:hypothetical protein
MGVSERNAGGGVLNRLAGCVHTYSNSDVGYENQRAFPTKPLLGNCHPDWFHDRISRLYLHRYLMQITKMFHPKETIRMKHR